LFCRCLHYFSSNEKLETHVAECREINDYAIRLPNENDKWLHFNNYSRKERIPFVCMYADLECILEKTDSDQRTSQHHRIFSLTTMFTTPTMSRCVIMDFVAIRMRCVVRRGTQKFSSSCKILCPPMFPWKLCRANSGRHFATRCSVTCARNRLRRMIHAFAIIAI